VEVEDVHQETKQEVEEDVQQEVEEDVRSGIFFFFSLQFFFFAITECGVIVVGGPWRF
jgi:hypothetical protein